MVENLPDSVLYKTHVCCFSNFAVCEICDGCWLFIREKRERKGIYFGGESSPLCAKSLFISSLFLHQLRKFRTINNLAMYFIYKQSGQKSSLTLSVFDHFLESPKILGILSAQIFISPLALASYFLPSLLPEFTYFSLPPARGLTSLLFTFLGKSSLSTTP